MKKVFFVLSMIIFLFPTHVFAESEDLKIEINKQTNHLYLYQDDQVVKTYRIATGRSAELTPIGTFEVGVKIVKPGWKGIPGGHPDNPLGPRWIGLVVNNDRAREYGIHGTNDPDSIGKHASSGCVRMYNEEVIELYQRIYEGAPVWIHNGSSNHQWRGNPNIGLKPASGKVQVTASILNIRSGPSTGAFIIEKAERGERLQLIGQTQHWFKIKLSNGKSGFVHKDYVNHIPSYLLINENFFVM